jgi:hypothetical protein
MFTIFTLLASQYAFSGSQCESNFTVEGSFFSGKIFSTWSIESDVDEKDAFKKIYLHISKEGWKIENADREIGIISAVQDVSYGKGKSVPLNIVVEDSDSKNVKVSISYTLSGGVSSPKKAVLEAFCKIISTVKS